ncbi:MAG: hypothetical protein JWQ16_1721 [Novosphingobium sp.]|nr:hypothetical protein [Novosphingobium sp.]
MTFPGKLTDEELTRILDDESPLRVWREKRGISRADFAFDAGISVDRLDRYEAEVEVPEDAELALFAQLLQVEVVDLVIPPAGKPAETAPLPFAPGPTDHDDL